MTQEILYKIVDFIQKYLPYTDKELIKDYLEQHLHHHTIDYAIDTEGEVIGVCRWNLSEDGKTAHILDLAIRPDFRGKGVSRNFLERGLKIWKNVTHLVFERGARGDKREHKLPIEAILKRNIF
jgi:N-acetylglutamate synthase-like GNAT family acetyltransferase